MSKIGQRLIGKTIEPSGMNVSFKLLIPLSRIEFRIPRPKLSQFFRWQFCKCMFNFLDRCHGLSILIAHFLGKATCD